MNDVFPTATNINLDRLEKYQQLNVYTWKLRKKCSLKKKNEKMKGVNCVPIKTIIPMFEIPILLEYYNTVLRRANGGRVCAMMLNDYTREFLPGVPYWRVRDLVT